MTRILLAIPLRQKPHIFVEFQKSIDNLIIPEGCILDRFYIVNNCPEIKDYITSGMVQEHNFVNVQEEAHVWKSRAIENMIDMRNHCFSMAYQNNYDYVFSVDSDLVLDPRTLQHLLNYHTDIIGEAFWTNSKIGLWYNAGLYNIYTMDPTTTDLNRKAIIQHQKPGVYQVGMTGACVLISKRVWEAGVNYNEVPYQWCAPQSEDRNFCMRAAVAGFPIYIDTTMTPTHLFDDDHYNAYMERIGSDLRAPSAN